MKLYFPVVGEDHLNDLVSFNIKFNILVSFAYSKKIDLRKAFSISKNYFLFDSGAFTTWKGGKDVKLSEYLKAIEVVSDIAKDKLIAINLDVIPGKFGIRPSKNEIDDACKKSFQNYSLIKEKFPNLKIMPVFHQYDDFRWLEKYLEDDPFVLGISPANDRNTKGRMPWLDKVFSIIKDKKKCHGLAVSSKLLLERYPWYSADSASWSVAPSVGKALFFTNKGVESYHYKDKEKVLKNNFVRYIVEGGNEYSKRRRQSIVAMLKLEEYITNLWNKKGVVWDE